MKVDYIHSVISLLLIFYNCEKANFLMLSREHLWTFCFSGKYGIPMVITLPYLISSMLIGSCNLVYKVMCFGGGCKLL